MRREKNRLFIFDRLNFLSDMYSFFQGGIFYDSVRIRNCKSPETETDLSLCNYLFSLVEDITQARHSVFVSVTKTGLKKRSQLGTAFEGIHTAGSASGCVREKQDYRSRVVAKGGGDGSCIRTFDFSVGND